MAATPPQGTFAKNDLHFVRENVEQFCRDYVEQADNPDTDVLDAIRMERFRLAAIESLKDLTPHDDLALAMRAVDAYKAKTRSQVLEWAANIYAEMYQGRESFSTLQPSDTIYQTMVGKAYLQLLDKPV